MECIPLKIGDYDIGVSPDMRLMFVCDSNVENACTMHFEHIQQVTELILALKEMRKSFLNEIK